MFVIRFKNNSSIITYPSPLLVHFARLNGFSNKLNSHSAEIKIRLFTWEKKMQ